ncbi:MAG: glycosyltransferase [Lachnospiraceae bacterium]|nr:glycosyltransferase [Lachnospiraceae bacterium]
MAEALRTDVNDSTAASKRIVVLDIAASKTGALSILRDYYAHVQSLNDDNEWYFIIGAEGLIKEDSNKPNIHVIVREDVKNSRFKRLLFDHFSGKDFLRELKPDLIISLQNTLPVGAEKLAETKIYLHQPLGFQKIKKFSFFNKWERGLAVYQYLIAGEIDRSLKRADSITVQTKWMKDAVIEKDGIAPEKIEVEAPEIRGVGGLCKPDGLSDAELCKPDAPEQSGVLCKPLFIFPAGNILYKNHQCILDAVKILSDRGIRGFRVIFTEEEQNLPWLKVHEECRDVIDWRGMIERDKLLSLYRKAVLLFPSYIETYGLPLAEARAAGAGIIAADTPFAREILSGYTKAEYFDPFDPPALAGLMEKAVTAN